MAPRIAGQRMGRRDSVLGGARISEKRGVEH